MTEPPTMHTGRILGSGIRAAGIPLWDTSITETPALGGPAWKLLPRAGAVACEATTCVPAFHASWESCCSSSHAAPYQTNEQMYLFDLKVRVRERRALPPGATASVTALVVAGTGKVKLDGTSFSISFCGSGFPIRSKSYKKTDLSFSGSPPTGSSSWSWTDLKPGPSFPSSVWVKGPQAGEPCSTAFPGAWVQLDWKWSSRDSNQCLCGRPGSWAEA